MSHTPITIGGIPIPSDDPAFLALLAVHVAAGLTCVLTGAVAMLSNKSPGRHPRYGTIYYRSLGIVFITMTVLSVMRWAQDYRLFILGGLSFVAALVGRSLAPSRSAGHVRIHVTAMGLSYIILLTAFYVDNGKNLPLWRSLPSLAYWLVPLGVGLPLIIRVLLTHPLVHAERQSPQTGGAA